MDISDERDPMEEAAHLLMDAERHKFINLNAYGLTEAAIHEAQQVTQNEKYHREHGILKARWRREVPPSSVTVMHR
jgi:hypothetical protein